MHSRPKRLHDAFQALPFQHLRHDLNLRSTNPIGHGTRGIVYPTMNPRVVVKLIDDYREPLVAARLATLNLQHVARVFGSYPIDLKVTMKDGTRKKVRAHLTYLESLSPTDGVRREAHEYLHEAMTGGNGHYHVPRAFLEAFDAQHKAAKPQHKPYLDEFRAVIEEILNAGEWHRDLKVPNLMLDDEGTLKISDIGSFTEEPLLIQRDPPVSRQEVNEDTETLEDMADRYSGMKHASLASRLQRLAQQLRQEFTPVQPLDGLGSPDPFHDDPQPSEITTSEAWLPDDIMHDPKPDGGKWRTPNSPTGPTVRVPYLTYDTDLDRSKMDGSDAARFPLDHHRRG